MILTGHRLHSQLSAAAGDYIAHEIVCASELQKRAWADGDLQPGDDGKLLLPHLRTRRISVTVSDLLLTDWRVTEYDRDRVVATIRRDLAQR